MRILTLGAGGMSEAFDGIKIPQSECDVRDIGDVSDVIHEHQPDVVIMTAGVSNPDTMEHARFEDELTTNLLGAFNIAQIAINCDVQTMIFIASVAGLYGKPYHAAYSASKAGVISLVQSLAMEGHDAYAISPGRVDTPMRQKDYPHDLLGSRLSPDHIWQVIRKILDGRYSSGDNVLIRKVGLTDIIEEVTPVRWRDILKVGQPVTI